MCSTSPLFYVLRENLNAYKPVDYPSYRGWELSDRSGDNTGGYHFRSMT